MNTRVIAPNRISKQAKRKDCLFGQGNHKGCSYMLFLLSLMLLLAACGQQSTTTTGGASTQATPTPTPVLDVYGTPIVVSKTPPQRIVSLVPSTSEILGALHLESRVVGIDYYTNYPASLSSRPKVSNANGVFNVEQIVALKPDLVLSYGGETKTYDTKLKQLGLNVVDLQLTNLTQSLQDIVLVGRLTSTVDAANALVQQLQKQVDQIKVAVKGTTAPSILLEVDDSAPGKPFVFGGGSFGDELAQDAGAVNIFHNSTSNGGYPQVTDEAIITANPQYIILTEDPAYGGDATAVYKRPNWGTIAAVKNRKVYHVNVDIIQRPGPRLVEGLQCVAQLVHPDKFSGALPGYCSASV
ncbi:MAG: ABC transporter substrate-binding protein [Ktedonobacteraceae bacterium]